MSTKKLCSMEAGISLLIFLKLKVEEVGLVVKNLSRESFPE